MTLQKNEPKNVPRGFRFLSDSPKRHKGQALWKPAAQTIAATAAQLAAALR